MKLELTRNTIVNGEIGVAGDVVEASERDGRYLVAIGKAVIATADAEPDPVETDEVECEKQEAEEAVIATAVPGGKRTRKPRK